MSAIRLRRVLLGNESWRALKPGGILRMECPDAAKGAGQWQVPRHTTHWTPNGLQYFQDGSPARQIAELPRMIIFGVMLTIPWYAGAAAVFKFADPFLKRVSVLLPMQLAIYSVYGQRNGARPFHGLLPILTGIYLCFTRKVLLQPAIHGRSSAPAAVAQ
jgi:hypothetical protein